MITISAIRIRGIIGVTTIVVIGMIVAHRMVGGGRIIRVVGRGIPMEGLAAVIRVGESVRVRWRVKVNIRRGVV